MHLLHLKTIERKCIANRVVFRQCPVEGIPAVINSTGCLIKIAPQI